MKKLLLLLLLPLTTFAQNNYQAKLNQLMEANVNVNHFNGNILVAKAGKVIYQKAFGYRNYSTKQLLNNNTVFELASLSKQFTGMGILILKEQGKLKLEDSLRHFFPELPYEGVTIKHLLTHTAGLPDYMDAMEPKWDHQKIAFNKDMIAFLAAEKIPAKFKPGTRFEYSNTGYALLASIIEKVSGQTLSTFMRQHIFKPLQMDRSRIYNTRRSKKDTISNYAYGYVYEDSLKRYVLPDSLKKYDVVYYLDGIAGDGVVNSTTGDLLIWDRALKNHRLISAPLQAEMFADQSLMDTVNKAYYGYGVFTATDQYGKLISHSGSWIGYRTILTRYVDQDITVIILSNNESNVTALASAVTAIMFNKEVIPPYIHHEVTLKSETLNSFAGTFERHLPVKNAMITIIYKDGKLYRTTAGSPDLLLKAESNNKLFYTDGTDRQMEFVRDKSGKIIGGWFIANGIKSKLTVAR
ncbi:beta-lactamase family protein [Mucilaginibacter sp. RS28]|uniref:Beta-lactamase family protein n=1 Tax=Mucilaginibacter straminoryzae TaxID=2932774 RepID=A0A9X1X2C5_9SPHI|nr:serine hydrolase domain-containing protein [Mucilaginibacter straminoryzae]MCJ8209859.1 beta-lactamase family protein [Mucilaginibacter straminoryzae]